MKVVEIGVVDFAEVVTLLRQGGTIIYPTETCYGLGADVRNAEAIAQIFSIKHRPLEKTALMIMADVTMARHYVVWNDAIEKIAATYWPGPLTVVAQSRPNVFLPPGVRRDDGTVAFRISDYPLVNTIVQMLGAPLLSTSANIAAEPNMYSSMDVVARFQASSPQPDLVIAAGDLPLRPPSTIIALENKTWRVVRQGAIVLKQ